MDRSGAIGTGWLGFINTASGGFTIKRTMYVQWAPSPSLIAVRLLVILPESANSAKPWPHNPSTTVSDPLFTLPQPDPPQLRRSWQPSWPSSASWQRASRHWFRRRRWQAQRLLSSPWACDRASSSRQAQEQNREQRQDPQQARHRCQHRHCPRQP